VKKPARHRLDTRRSESATRVHAFSRPTSATGSRQSPIALMPASPVTARASARKAYLTVAWFRDSRGCALMGPAPGSGPRRRAGRGGRSTAGRRQLVAADVVTAENAGDTGLSAKSCLRAARRCLIGRLRGTVGLRVERLEHCGGAGDCDLATEVDVGGHRGVGVADILGGRHVWGVEALLPDRFFVDPGHLLEQVMVPTLRLLDGLMARTPVQRLPGVALSEADCRLPEGRGAFDAKHRESVLWQLAL